MQHAPKTQFIERIAVEEEGSGDAVLFIHGLGGSSNTFTALLQADGPFQRYRCVRIDLPGSGRSGRVDGTIDLARYLQGVKAVCAALGIARTHVVAHSMGTIIAQHLAAQEPRLVRSLALFGPLFCPTEAARVQLRARADKVRKEGTLGIADIAQALSQGSVSAKTKRNAPTAAAFVRESVMRQRSELYAATCEALAEMQSVDPAKIICPTLLVTGDEDTVAPPQAVRGMHNKIASSTTHVLFGCGHWTPIEQPHECAQLLRSFYMQRM
jgi:3-oxoadipate enol-lactonase